MVFLLLIPVIPMALSDFRHRKIPLWALLLFFAVSLPVSARLYDWTAVANNILSNLLLLFYLGAGIWLYLLIRCRGFIDPFKRHIGLGDFLFMLASTPLFGPKDFLVFLLSSMLGGLLWWALSGCKKSIPLVGVLGITLGIYLIAL